MGRNEIRLRRNNMTSGRIAQHRNYGDVMARHEREVKLRMIIRSFVYFLIILFIVLVYVMVTRWLNQEPEKGPARPATSFNITKSSSFTE